MTKDREEKMWKAIQEMRKDRIEFLASCMVVSADAYFHECDVILPAEELLAESHGRTAAGLEEDWAKSRRKEGWFCRQGASLRDSFFEIVDSMAAETGKNYDDYIRDIEPSVFMSMFKEKTGL